MSICNLLGYNSLTSFRDEQKEMTMTWSDFLLVGMMDNVLTFFFKKKVSIFFYFLFFLVGGLRFY